MNTVTAEEKLAIEFIKSHGEGDEGFIKNEHGQYIYKAGPHGINLTLVLADFAKFLNENIWEDAINARIERLKSTIERFQGEENAGVRIQSQSKIVMLEEIIEDVKYKSK